MVTFSAQLNAEVIHAPDGVPSMCGGGWKARGCDEVALHSTRYDHLLCSQDKVTSADNWDSVKAEICRSNIMQRDNILFARKLSKDLVKLAKEKNKYVSKFIFLKSSFCFYKVYLCTFLYP
jgi:hypothetical protein